MNKLLQFTEYLSVGLLIALCIASTVNAVSPLFVKYRNTMQKYVPRSNRHDRIWRNTTIYM
jgi:hypothetical protein